MKYAGAIMWASSGDKLISKIIWSVTEAECRPYIEFRKAEENYEYV